MRKLARVMFDDIKNVHTGHEGTVGHKFHTNQIISNKLEFYVGMLAQVGGALHVIYDLNDFDFSAKSFKEIEPEDLPCNPKVFFWATKVTIKYKKATRVLKFNSINLEIGL